MSIRVVYDVDDDAASVYLTEIKPGGSVRQVEAVPGRVILDFDQEGRLIGIEVLGARKYLPKDVLNAAEWR